MLRNFEKFEVGHYYVYTGEEREYGWIPFGTMDFVLDHKILQCSQVSIEESTANFRGHERIGSDFWDWKEGFDNWIEVESPDAVFEVGDSVLEYNQHYKHWKEIVIAVCYLTEYKQKNGYDNDSFIYYILKRKPKVPTVKDSLDRQLGIVPIDKPPTINNLFKKYIRKRKYLTFSKKK